MPISVVGSETFTSQTDASGVFTINVPAGVQNGDFMLLTSVTYSGAASSQATPSGWTSLDKRDATYGYGSFAIYWRIASSEPASYNVKASNVLANVTGGMLAVRSVDGTTPINAWGRSADTRTCPSVTTSVDNTLVLRLALVVPAENSFSWPAGQTEQWDLQYGNSYYAHSAQSLAHAAQASAGATGTKVVTASDTSAYYANAVTIALAPAVPIGQPTMARWQGVPGMKNTGRGGW